MGFEIILDNIRYNIPDNILWKNHEIASSQTPRKLGKQIKVQTNA